MECQPQKVQQRGHPSPLVVHRYVTDEAVDAQTGSYHTLDRREGRAVMGPDFTGKRKRDIILTFFHSCRLLLEYIISSPTTRKT